ncbi:MAG: hypothetical protein NTZ15_04400 [Burkholderiales bacterium]|nr:hypothetical protein [Burkholderiales bacterium]
MIAAGTASAQTCPTIDAKEVASHFDRWNASLKTLDSAKVHARYTYVYPYTNGQWLIANHHSSAMHDK